jgi:hypothetical protein
MGSAFQPIQDSIIYPSKFNNKPKIDVIFCSCVKEMEGYLFLDFWWKSHGNYVGFETQALWECDGIGGLIIKLVVQYKKLHL